MTEKDAFIKLLPSIVKTVRAFKGMVDKMSVAERMKLRNDLLKMQKEFEATNDRGK